MAKPHRIIPELTDKDISRFWSKVDKRGPDECWPWMAYRKAQGYGQISLGNHLYRAHRIAYFLVYGAFPSELCLMHTCDNPPCCNRRHLSLGTRTDNSRDKVRKGRTSHAAPKGEAHADAKLTAQHVRQIRRRYAAGRITYRALAAEYGVAHSSIGGIVRRETWKHI